jgi:hypothetical protein
VHAGVSAREDRCAESDGWEKVRRVFLDGGLGRDEWCPDCEQRAEEKGGRMMSEIYPDLSNSIISELFTISC